MTEDSFEARIEALDVAMGGAVDMAQAFSGELQRMQATFAETSREVRVLEGGIGRGLRNALDGLVFDGGSLSDALRGLSKSMLDAAYSAAVRPVTDHVSGVLAGGMEALIQGLMPFEKGAGFAQGRVMPFASGAVVSGPVRFPMRGGTGLMGEAGPEAIMPLRRGADGRLGVESSGGGRAVNVTMNITTPDVAGFARSQSQIAAQLSRVISQGSRNR
ncbi:phage tail tape measure protein [Candidatus Halocynthiibacter alkanivorans]|uniref:phage tail tape measure protein n=1 Tax=Candidatus Halocynthiibacter alkanivorans TaxID=2267619 RepID=UPI000DF18D1C|nr:phage tail tape measure protein [Candidatus Halocynthiibacter alkanivorans]